MEDPILTLQVEAAVKGAINDVHVKWLAQVSEHKESPPDDESTLTQQFQAFNSEIIIAFNSEIIIATISASTEALDFE